MRLNNYIFLDLYNMFKKNKMRGHYGRQNVYHIPDK